MKTKKNSSIIFNQRGFTLAELMVVMVIMSILVIAIAEVTMRTVSAMLMATSQTVAQSSVEQVVTKMAEDIRTAGSVDKKHIVDGSSGTSIMFIRYGQNLDAFSPTSNDMNYDIACYSFVKPVGTDPYTGAYRAGYIIGGVGSGDVHSCPNKYRLTDEFTDIRDLKFQYCRPSGTNGEYTCSTGTTAIDNSGLDNYNNGVPAGGDLTTTAACVWMIKISVIYSRKHNINGQTMDPAYYNSAVYTYQTAVAPRNIITMSSFMNDKSKGDPDTQDCCDPFFANAADWCKPPQTN